MGESLKSAQVHDATKVKDSQELQEISVCEFSLISEQALKECLYKKNDVEEILSTFKLISNEQFFFDIAVEEAQSFVNLNEEDKNKIYKLSELFYNVLTTPTEIYEISPIHLEQRGELIAYINQRIAKLHIVWKNSLTKERVFNSLLENMRSKSEDYPEQLRSFANVEVFLDEKGLINIRFFAHKDTKVYYTYAPGYLRNFEQELREVFQRHFEGEELKFIF